MFRDPESLTFCAESRLMLLLILFCLVTDFLPRYDLRDLLISLKLMNVIVIKLVYLWVVIKIQNIDWCNNTERVVWSQFQIFPLTSNSFKMVIQASKAWHHSSSRWVTILQSYQLPLTKLRIAPNASYLTSELWSTILMTNRDKMLCFTAN